MKEEYEEEQHVVEGAVVSTAKKTGINKGTDESSNEVERNKNPERKNNTLKCDSVNYRTERALTEAMNQSSILGAINSFGRYFTKYGLMHLMI